MIGDFPLALPPLVIIDTIKASLNEALNALSVQSPGSLRPGVSGGPGPSPFAVSPWHRAHFALNICAPAFGSPAAQTGLASSSALQPRDPSRKLSSR